MQTDAEEKKISLAGMKPYLKRIRELDKIWIYDVIDSTNNEAKRRAMAGAPDGTVVLADSQTAGRGRQGRNFYSPADSGVYCSILLRPSLSIEDVVQITVAASVAVGRAISSVVGQYPQIKWVNDLYMEDRKVCGILAEMVQEPKTGKAAVVVGVGINCTTVFPEELQEIAGNLPQTQNSAVLRNRLAAELIYRISCLEEMILQGDFLEEYREHSMVIGKYVTLLNEPERCYFVKGIGESGELLLIDERGEMRRLSSGEISIRLTVDKTKKP